MLFLFGLACAVYSPSLSGDFVLDDSFNIVQNPYLSSPGLWYLFLLDRRSQTVAERISGQAYRPLVTLSFAVSHWAGGLNPFWYHLTSVLLHAGNTCLVFLLIRLLLKLKKQRDEILPAFAAAALFCLHPAQVESVSFISVQAALWSLFFCLLGFLSYVYRGILEGAWAKRWMIAASIAPYVLALLSKETSVFLAPVLVMYDLVFQPIDEDWKTRLRRWAPYWVVLGPYFWCRHFILGRLAQLDEPWGGSWLVHAELAVHGLMKDFSILFWPMSLRRCYSFRQGPWFGLNSVWMFLALLGLGLTALALIRKRRLEGFALGWIGMGLVPVSNIIPIDGFAADRFLYIPMTGFALLAGYWFSRWKMHRTALVVVWLCLASLMSLKTLGQELAWQSDFELNLASYAADPTDPCTSLHLGVSYYQWGMLGKAEAFFSQALAGRPSVLEQSALMGLSLVCQKRGDMRQAYRLLMKARDINPKRKDLSELLQALDQERFRAEPSPLTPHP